MSNYPRRIWALVSGEYSDYEVHAMFTSKKVAEAAAEPDPDEYGYRPPRVEEYLLYDAVPDKIDLYEIHEDLWDNGDCRLIFNRVSSRMPWNHWKVVPKHGKPKVRYVRAPVHENRGGRLEVWGTDEQAVKQAFSDNKARIRAERAGIA